jgi:hypothetical protein
MVSYSRRIKWVWYVVRMRDMRNSYRVLGGETQEKRPLGSTWEHLGAHGKITFKVDI